jgi:hypothetical protein
VRIAGVGEAEDAAEAIGGEVTNLEDLQFGRLAEKLVSCGSLRTKQPAA